MLKNLYLLKDKKERTEEQLLIIEKRIDNLEVDIRLEITRIKASNKNPKQGNIGLGKNRKATTKENRKNKIPTKRITVEKTTLEIINELQGKGITLKNIAKKLKISESALYRHRQFLIGNYKPRTKREPNYRSQILEIAKAKKVDKNKEAAVFKYENIGKDLIKIPKLDKSKKYIHALYTVQVTFTDGLKKNVILGQVYQVKDGKQRITELATKYFQAELDRPYVLSLKLLRFGHRYF
jgi:hypothetical protein